MIVLYFLHEVFPVSNSEAERRTDGLSTSYMIGVDIGTTSTKAVLFKENGTIVAQSNQGYPLHQPSPLSQNRTRSRFWKP